jgi:hypothetical protein
MPRKQLTINPDHLDALKQFVREKAKLHCNSTADIEELRLKIKASQNERLSPQTLKRLFGVIKSNFNPALDTLNILSRYLGYESFSDFEAFNEGKQPQPHQRSLTFNVLAAILNHLEQPKMDSDKINQLVQNILMVIERDPSLCTDFYPYAAATDFGRKHFYEQNVNMDALNGHYGNGLKLYLVHATNNLERLYAYCMLCLKYFLKEDIELFFQYYSFLKLYDKDDIQQSPPLTASRYYATLILGNALQNTLALNIETLMADIKNHEGRNACIKRDPNCISPIIDALVLTGYLDEAYQLLRNISITVYPMEQSGNRTYNQLNLMVLFIEVFSGKISIGKATHKYNNSIDGNYPKGCEMYYTIFEKILKEFLRMRQNNGNNARHLLHLINETGFNYFHLFKNRLLSEKSLMDINGYKV